MVDPAVAYQPNKGYKPFDQGVSDDIFMKESNGSFYKGVVWPSVTVYPDWFHPKVGAYSIGQFKSFFNPDTGIDIDGVWIDMNEPASVSPKSDTHALVFLTHFISSATTHAPTLTRKLLETPLLARLAPPMPTLPFSKTQPSARWRHASRRLSTTMSLPTRSVTPFLISVTALRTWTSSTPTASWNTIPVSQLPTFSIQFTKASSQITCTAR